MRQPVTTIDIRRDLVGLLPRLRRFAMTLTGDVAAADELVQSVCQRAVAKSQQWNGEGRLESWVYTLARHLWNDEGRKRRPRPAAPKGNVTDIREAARERTTVTDTDLVHRMLAEMPENLASIFLLTVVKATATSRRPRSWAFRQSAFRRSLPPRDCISPASPTTFTTGTELCRISRNCRSMHS